jgi:UDP-3-O-[3-hydroxymyristoyl] glucosamine N-acyltransferase
MKRQFFIQVVLLFFPWAIRRRILTRIGFSLAPGAYIGFSIVTAKSVVLAEDARIGHLTMIKKLDLLCLGEKTLIGNLNWITGFPGDHSSRFVRTGRVSSLTLGEHAAITHRHYIDCTAPVSIGAFSTLAGVRTQIFTHSINLETCKQESSAVSIGNYCLIGTGSILLPGAAMADYSVLSAGSMLKSRFVDTHVLLSGIPAAAVKRLSPALKYFHRDVGAVT